MLTARSLVTYATLFALIHAAVPGRAAASPPDADLPSLVDSSFQTDEAIVLVADKPVAEEPAVPPGVDAPDNKLTVLYIVVAAAGGFVAGLFVGCLFCFATYVY